MSIGFARLLLDGEPLINNVPPWWQPGDALFGAASTELREDSPPLEAGKSYRIEVRLHRDKRIAGMGGVPGPGAIRIGALPVVPHDEALAEAVRKAKEADVAIVVVGTNPEVESEGFDREHNHLPPGSDELVEKVCEAQKDTIVVVQSGMPCAMPFADKPGALLQVRIAGSSRKAKLTLFPGAGILRRQRSRSRTRRRPLRPRQPLRQAASHLPQDSRRHALLQLFQLTF